MSREQMRERFKRWLAEEWKSDVMNTALLGVALFLIWMLSGKLAG